MLKTAEEQNIVGDDRTRNSDLRDKNIQHPQSVNKLHIPPPSKGHQNSVLMASMPKRQPDNEGRRCGPGAHRVNQDPEPQPVDYTGLQLDDHGMILPHSILGSLEDFRCYLEDKGDTELAKRIAVPQRDPRRPHTEALKRSSETSSGFRDTQSNALQHWQTQMSQRRQQQDFLSDLLNRPVENLLMNQGNNFRETQEQRELINQAMPLIHSGYGHRVGSEFWSLPQHYGDDISGISTTLTQTEQGRREPVTHVGQPRSIRQESGLTHDKTLRPASLYWDQSEYLQYRCQELGEVLKDMDIKKPDISRLEVIGSCKPFTHITVCRSPSLENDEEETENMKKESLDPLAQFHDVQSDVLLVPALRFCGQLACWTGHSRKQGEIGISATIMFEALAGEMASSHMDLHNEGSTAIFYSWQQLSVPPSLPNLRPQTKGPCFYFNPSPGVILPGGKKQLEFIFKSAEPGIKTEVWQFNTHPVLLGGASMQVTLRGVALYQDTTADLRLYLETKLEKTVTVKLCRSIVYEVLQGVRSPERPSSPAELYMTEEQRFLIQNPKLQFLDETMEELNKLWQEVSPEHAWDLSVDTLRQAVLSHPDQEEKMNQLNSLILQLLQPPVQKHKHLTAAAAGLRLWRKLFDTMDDEARWLRDLLGLPHRDTWSQDKEDLISGAEETSEKKDGPAVEVERSQVRSGNKDGMKGQSRFSSDEKQMEDSRGRGRRRDWAERSARGKQGKEPLTGAQTESELQEPSEDEGQGEEPEVFEVYTRLLHRKVYALVEDLVDSLCGLMDDLGQRDDN